MQKEIRMYAPAKVNIGLNIFPKRKDGFHNIESIFQTISFYDEILIKTVKGFGKCTLRCKDVVLPDINTISSAYTEFCNSIGRNIVSVDVEITKRIPLGSGLGGGSSDAAFFVKGLEVLTGIALNKKQLYQIASKIGSDVFFFISCSKDKDCAIVSGRGEKVQNIVKRKDLYFVLIFTNVHSSTQKAYNLLDEYSGYADKEQGFYSLEKAYNEPLTDWNFSNSFTPILKMLYPEIGSALNLLDKSGAEYFEMTGSGSVVFGIFRTESKAKSAVQIITSYGFECVLTV